MAELVLADILPISEVTKTLANQIAHTARTRRPVVITQHGAATAVIVAAAHWQDTQDELTRLRERVAKLEE